VCHACNYFNMYSDANAIKAGRYAAVSIRRETLLGLIVTASDCISKAKQWLTGTFSSHTRFKSVVCDMAIIITCYPR